MRLTTARAAWHDSSYVMTRGGLSGLTERARLGVAVQTTARGNTADHAVHAALAGMIQSVIARLHPQIRVFGEFMYSALQDEAVREAAEEVVYAGAMSKAKRMTETKREKARYVAMGVAFRYRYMHQGGQSANADPLAKPELFRAWLFNEYGVRLESTNWARDWEEFIDSCFQSCEELDRRALSPVAAVIYEAKEVA